MPFLPRKGILAIAAVVDIALNDREHPVSAKTLAVRHGLPPRHLEPVLQALVREGILKGIRGPGGGYELAAEAREITAAQILHAAELMDEERAPESTSPLVVDIVLPAIAHAEKALLEALGRITIEDMVRPNDRRRAANTCA
ncbi:MAG TPA: Rrf2 family transcriptional regulator [Xanthobacteraceae bacterium]|jgi:Rrf2 family protein|nr:Rrf2 family transcriptional regulator [Xanthobacteraceae bacterium]